MRAGKSVIAGQPGLMAAANEIPRPLRDLLDSQDGVAQVHLDLGFGVVAGLRPGSAPSAAAGGALVEELFEHRREVRGVALEAATFSQPGVNSTWPQAPRQPWRRS